MKKSYYENVFIYGTDSFEWAPFRDSQQLSKISQAIIDAGYNITPDITRADKIYVIPGTTNIETLKNNFGKKIMLTLK